jgi:putative DNA primase/helicase
MGIYTLTAACAHEYHRAGLAVVPLRTDGSKAPLVQWARATWRKPSWEELAPYFNRTAPAGIGILCGERSGGLEVLDFDDPAIYPAWASRVVPGLTGLLGTLPLVETPSGGRHLWYRCPTIEGNLVLARDRQSDNAPARLPPALIETRGEGGLVVAAGSPLEVHWTAGQVTGNLYDLLQGDPRKPPVITAEQREALFAAARGLNRYTPPPPRQTLCPPARRKAGSKGRALPGDKFNATASWEGILEPHGWRVAGVKGATLRWTKPNGSAGQVHATTGHGEADCLYVFSTDALPFEGNQAYSKFAAYAILTHGGDFRAAAQALAKQTP